MLVGADRRPLFWFYSNQRNVFSAPPRKGATVSELSAPMHACGGQRLFRSTFLQSCLQDFVKKRCSSQAPQTYPRLVPLNSVVGFDDFYNLCWQVNRPWLGIPDLVHWGPVDRQDGCWEDTSLLRSAVLFSLNGPFNAGEVGTALFEGFCRRKVCHFVTTSCNDWSENRWLSHAEPYLWHHLQF